MNDSHAPLPRQLSASVPPSGAPGFSVSHSVTALACLILGYLFLQWVGRSSLGGSAFLFSVVFSLPAVILLIARRRFRALPIILLACLVLLPTVFLTAPGSPAATLVLFFEMLGYPIWYYLTFGKEDGKIDDTFFFDAVKALFVMPFSAFASIFPALIAPLKNAKKGRTAACILLGIAIAFLPALVVTALLSSADPAFGEIARRIARAVFGSSVSEILFNLYLALFSIPVSMYFFSMIFTNREGRCRGILNEEAKKRHTASLSRLPVVAVCSAVIPLLLIYLLFFISQLGYYVKAFAGIVPEGYSAAEYARSGFFQLCVVTFLNLCVILFASLLSKKAEGRQSGAVRVLNVILSVFTLILIATAFRKMVLYIGLFGFTRLRLLTSWFMVLLAVIFLLIILRQLRPSFPVVPSSCAAFLILFSTLCLLNPDAAVVKLNVRLYQDGVLPTCDVGAFYSLSYSAAEYVIPLLSDENEEIASAAEQYLRYQAESIESGYRTPHGKRDYTPALLRLRDRLSGVLGREIVIGQADSPF